jgi:hypothetical protein
MAAVDHAGDVQRWPTARLAVEQGAPGHGEAREEAHKLRDAEAKAVHAREMRRRGQSRVGDGGPPWRPCRRRRRRPKFWLLPSTSVAGGECGRVARLSETPCARWRLGRGGGGAWWLSNGAAATIAAALRGKRRRDGSGEGSRVEQGERGTVKASARVAGATGVPPVRHHR